MTQQARERALRLLAAALINSDLSASEVEEVVASLRTDARFGERLARLVSGVLQSLPEPSRRNAKPQKQKQQVPSAKAARQDALESILRIVRSLPLGKEEVLARLRQHPRSVNWSPRPSWSLRQIIESFFRRLSPAEMSDALATLTVGTASPDPYMEGIASRKEIPE